MYTYLASGVRTFHHLWEHHLDVVARYAKSEWSETDAEISGLAASCFGRLSSDLHVCIVRACRPDFESAEGFFLSCQYTHRWLREKLAVAEPMWSARRILKLSGWHLDRAIARSPLRIHELLRWQALALRHIDCCHPSANQAIEIVAKNARALDLSQRLCERVSDAQLVAISKYSEKLHTLRLVGTDVTICGLSAILNHCSELKTLTLECGHCSSVLLEIIAKANSKLQALHFFAWRWMDGSVNQFGTFMRACSEIEELTFAGCSWMADAHLAHIAKRATRLRSLDLTGCSALTPSGLRPILSQCKELESLDLSECAWHTDEWIALLAARGTALKRLGLAWCGCATAPHLKRLLQGLNQLEALNLNSCAWLAEEELAVITALGIHLRRLDLDSCGRITEGRLEAMLKGMPSLESISLSPYNPLTGKAIDIIAEHGGRLKRLGLKRCEAITKAHLENIFKHCMALEELLLDENASLSDEALMVIAEHGGRLKRLSLRQCSGITSRGVKIILDSCQSLEACEREIDECQGSARNETCALM